MSSHFNYRHLYYFWVVAREGSMSRAADRLDMAVQTISTQVRALERDLGCALLKPQGRGLGLTEAGQAALQQAERIFQLGETLRIQVQDAAGSASLRLQVGVCDSLGKLAVHRLLQPVIQSPQLRLLCQQGPLETLLGRLALHQLDLVLADRSAPHDPNLPRHSHPLGSAALAWYASPGLLARARQDFPRSLAQVPVLLPATESAMRAKLDHWFERQGLRPRIAGEFDDSALLKTFGASGLGVFPAALAAQDDLLARYSVQPAGPCSGVEESLYLIANVRRVPHPLVQRLIDASLPA